MTNTNEFGAAIDYLFGQCVSSVICSNHLIVASSASIFSVFERASKGKLVLWGEQPSDLIEYHEVTELLEAWKTTSNQQYIREKAFRAKLGAFRAVIDGELGNGVVGKIERSLDPDLLTDWDYMLELVCCAVSEDDLRRAWIPLSDEANVALVLVNGASKDLLAKVEVAALSIGEDVGILKGENTIDFRGYGTVRAELRGLY